VARSKDTLRQLASELEETYGINAVAMAEDLSDPKAPQRLCEKLCERPIDVLVNNAGFGDFGLFQYADPQRIAAMLHLNVESLTLLTRLILPGMLQRGRGRILNIASTAAFQPGPFMAVYYATKAYVLSFSVALSDEMKHTGITVTCLCPGPTKTGFEAHANLAGSKLFKRGTMHPANVARIGFHACMSGRTLVTAGFINKIGAFLTRFAPRLWAAKVARMAQSPL
jgi:uncharacterized protein